MNYNELLHSFSTEEIPQDFGCPEGAAQFLKRKICAANNVLAPRFKPVPLHLGNSYVDFRIALRNFMVPYFISPAEWLNNAAPLLPLVNMYAEPEDVYADFLLATTNILADNLSEFFLTLRSFAKTIQSRAKGPIIIHNKHAGNHLLEAYRIHRLLFSPVGKLTIVNLEPTGTCLFVRLHGYLSYASRDLIRSI